MFQIGYKNMEIDTINAVVNKFYKDLDEDDFYEQDENQKQKFTSDGIPFRMFIISHGEHYI